MLSISYNQILDDLWVGSYPQSPEDVLHLKSLGIDAILNLQSADDLDQRAVSWDMFWKFYVRQGFTVERVEITDFDPDDLLARLQHAVDALEQLHADGRAVYLHCTAGLNRSPTTAIAYLVQSRDMTLEDATKFVADRRECVPYPEVLESWLRKRG